MTQETKVCSKCLKEKSIDAFRWLSTPKRYQSRCRVCEREYTREYQKSIPADKRAEYAITHKLTKISAFKVLKLLTKQKDNYMNQLQTIQTNIEQWAIDRNLHTGDPNRQVLKLIEEQGELAAAIARNNREGIIDAVGDVVFVAVVLAKQLNAPVDLWESFEKNVLSNVERPSESAAVNFLADCVARVASAVHFNLTAGASTLIEHVFFGAEDIATAMDIDFIAAVQSAYDTVKDRKGKLVNGVFIKEGE